MNLRKKTILVVVIVGIVTVAVLHTIFQTIILDSFAELEEKNTSENIDRLNSAISNEFAELNSKCGDWAEWDDTYNYVQDLNSAYKQANLVDASFVNIRANYILFANSSGQFVSGMAFDLKNMTEISIPQSILKMISVDATIWRHETLNSSIVGLTSLPEGPLLFASRPILTSQREGPIQGTLIFARYFDNDEIEHLATLLHLPLKTYTVGDSQTPSDFQEAEISLSKDSPTTTKASNSDVIYGYSLLNDFQGTPILVMRLEMSRAIYKQGQTTISYLVASTFAVVAVLCLLIFYLFRFTVLNRLSLLSANVERVGKDKDLSARVPRTGSDEIADLACSINGMLATIEEKNAELRKAERLAAIGGLATMVAHDLRNPLQGIATSSHNIRKTTDNLGNYKVTSMLERIDDAVKYSERIVAELLDYSAELKLDLMETDPKFMVNLVISKMTVPSDIKVVDETSEKPKIFLDIDRMRRVLVNLISNAFEAMSKGGKLTISSREVNDKLELIFTDNGVGIPKYKMDRLWTPFVTTRAKGMGLGLPICKRIIEAHGGEILVKSEENVGTTFTLVLPITAAKKPETVLAVSSEVAFLSNPESRSSV
jgi:sensor domain CHASE-containing protein/nitrogen-specific signal transduction histidine kinase